MTQEFKAGDKVIYAPHPEYGKATVTRGVICQLTGQIEVKFPDCLLYSYCYPENLSLVGQSEA